jgi:phosphate transport system substrate-binding protein
LLNQTVDFGASDAPMTDEMPWPRRRAKSCTSPSSPAAWPSCTTCPGNPKLKLDGDTLANIYLGNITKWNDPKIAALNPGVDLPDLAIVPVHRTEGSGTTFIFTDYLSSVNPGLGGHGGQKHLGEMARRHRPGRQRQRRRGRPGQTISGAIGYGELAYADQSKIPYADMKNSSGNFISPAPDSVSAALATAQDSRRFPFLDGQRVRRRRPIPLPAPAGCWFTSSKRAPTTAKSWWIS